MNGSPSPASPFAKGTVSIAIISKGRPEILNDTLESLSRQTLPPTQIVVVVPTAADLPSRSWGPPVECIVGFIGGCVQRNKALEAIPSSVDYVGFFDDDFELKTDFLEEAVRFMNDNASVMGLSGLVLADGNVTREAARELVSRHPSPPEQENRFQSEGKFHSLYGCNMVIRRSILEIEKFDENLSLYSFAEDYDLSVRLERHGKVGKFNRCVGVHLAAKGGRVREVQRGYAFVANPWYFMRKGISHLSPTKTWIRFWVICAGKTCAISAWKIVTRDQSLDWPGRLKGNLLAIRDIFTGRCHPRRVEEL